MPTPIVYHVNHDIETADTGNGSSGTPYSRLLYALEQLAAGATDWVASDTYPVIECRGGTVRNRSTAWTVPDFGTRIAATHPLIIRPASEFRQVDGVWDPARFIWAFSTTGVPFSSPSRMEHWVIEDMQCQNTASSLSGGTWGSGYGRWERCVFHRHGRSAGAVTGGDGFNNTANASKNLRLHACRFIGSWFDLVVLTSNNTSAIAIENCTGVGSLGGIRVTSTNGPTTMSLRNTRVQRAAGASRACYSINVGSGSLTAEANLSDDDTSPNAALRNLSGVFVDAAGGDYQPAAGDPGIGVGVDRSSVLTLDIAREAWGSVWDIGDRRASSAAVIVADGLQFVQQPVATQVGSTMAAIVVAAVDSLNGDAIDATFTGEIVLTPIGGSYDGTLARAAVAGVATFDDLIPLTLGSSLSLLADASTFDSVSSALFNITLPSGGGGPTLLEEPMITPVLRNTTDPAKRLVFLRIRNQDGTPWAGATAGVKPLLNGTPLSEDVVRLFGELHAAQLSREQSNTTAPYLYVTLGADGTRLATSGIGLVSASDVTLEPLSLEAIAAAVVTEAQADGVGLTSEQVTVLTRAVFRALHYTDGFGVRRQPGDTTAQLVVPGVPDPISIPILADAGRPPVVQAGTIPE